MKFNRLRYSLRLIILFLSLPTFAIDTVKILKPPLLSQDKRTKHKEEVIQRALEVTVDEFGPFQFKTVNADMTPSRSHVAIQTGELINIYVGPSNGSWQNKAIAIKIPLRLGLLSYRLLLIHKSNQSKFDQVKTAGDLGKLTAGLQKSWVTTDIFNHHNFSAFIGHNFDGLFLMLQKQRFDYFPRAIYEIYDELQMRESILEGVVIEPNIALKIPMVTYVYVSPNEKVLANRLDMGLNKLVKSGELKTILEKYYASEIKQANLKNRRIIHINNPYFQDFDIINNKELWYEN